MTSPNLQSDFDKLNRLRVNAGRTELKSWKASGALLLEKIAELEAAGIPDTLPGANVKTTPNITPDLAEELNKEAETAKTTLGESALAKSVDNSKPEEPKKDKPKAKLARGLDTDQYARQCREKVRDRVRDEKAEAKAAKKAAKKLAREQEEKNRKLHKKNKKVKLSKEDKRAIKDEAESRIVGKVDEKKDPEKAKRQKDHIEKKQKDRAAKAGKEKPKDDKNFTVADLARELDIDPKTARNKLRRHEDKISKLHSKGQDRWTFPNEARKELTKLLKGEK